MITLYDSPTSGNAYKVRLLLSLLGIEYESIRVDLNAGDNRTPEFLARNPRGQIPVLVEGDTVVWDSQAILIYLARRYAGEEWLPLAPAAMAGVAQWLAVSENELLFGLARARAVRKFGRDFDLEACRRFGLGGLEVVNAGLEGRNWLVGTRATIADVACYPYVALAHEGGLSIDDQPNVPGWVRRVQALPGYTGMEGIAGHG